MTPLPDHLDLYELNRQLDITKSDVFMGSGAGFYGPLMCSMRYEWDMSVPTAATDGLSVFTNPDYFLSLPRRSRVSLTMHELKHPAYLHFIRQGGRDPYWWNVACDYRINNELTDQGYTWVGMGPLIDQKYSGWAEEDIYDDVFINKPQFPNFKPDMIETNEQNAAKIGELVSAVVRAAHQATTAGKSGDIPGNVQMYLDNFLAPIIPWQPLLKEFFQDFYRGKRSWRTRDRRFSHIYLPGKIKADGKLIHMMYFQDVSGSVKNNDILRFNSELKHIWERYKPDKMTIVQFDTRITKIDVYNKGDTFHEITVVGRGGTNLAPVRQMIIDEQPTAAIIFSDLRVTAMAPLPIPIPILWVCVGNRGGTVPFGKLIHIDG